MGPPSEHGTLYNCTGHKDMKLPLPADDPNVQLGLRITTELDTVRVGGQGSLAQTSSHATRAPTENVG